MKRREFIKRLFGGIVGLAVVNQLIENKVEATIINPIKYKSQEGVLTYNKLQRMYFDAIKGNGQPDILFVNRDKFNQLQSFSGGKFIPETFKYETKDTYGNMKREDYPILNSNVSSTNNK